jgi:hypothetical protein
MLHHLDTTLTALLLRELAPTYKIDAGNISFAAPDDQFRKSGYKSPTLNLFLYDMHENLELRSNEWDQRIEGGQALRQRPPARLDCAYLITTWFSSTGADTVRDEHALLGDIARVLMRYRTLPAELVAEPLKRAGLPLWAHVVQPTQHMSEFWQAMGGKPRVTLSYTVTISMNLSDPEPLGPPVKEKVIRIKSGGGTG